MPARVAGVAKSGRTCEVEIESLGRGRVGEPVVRTQGSDVVVGSHVVRQPGGRFIGGAPRVVQRRARVDESAGGVEVRRQVPRRNGSPRRRLLEGRRHARVQADAATGGQVPDDGLTHEGVGEAEPVRGAGGADEPRVLRRLERVERALGVETARRRDDVRIELLSRHRGGSQDLGCAGGQAAEPPADDVADTGRDSALRRLALPERSRHLPDEERVALGHREDPRRQLRCPAGVTEDRCDVALGQHHELEPADVRATREPGHHSGEQRRPGRLRIPVGRDDEQPHPDVGAEDMLQQQERQLVRPVQVVEHEQHRRNLARRLE